MKENLEIPEAIHRVYFEGVSNQSSSNGLRSLMQSLQRAEGMFHARLPSSLARESGNWPGALSHIFGCKPLDFVHLPERCIVGGAPEFLQQSLCLLQRCHLHPHTRYFRLEISLFSFSISHVRSQTAGFAF